MSRWVAGTRNDSGGRGPAPRAFPGEYTARLTVAGESYEQTLTVEPDPRSTATKEQLAAQIAFGLGLRDRMSHIVDVVNKIETVRGQLESRQVLLAGRDGTEAFLEAGQALAEALTAIEEELHNPRAEVNYDILAGRHGGAKLFSRLGWLAYGRVRTRRPADPGHAGGFGCDRAELAAQETALAGLIDDDLASLNAEADRIGLPFVLAP